MALYYKPGPTTEGIRNIIQGLLQEYNIESAADIQEALKDLLGGTIKEMMEAEMDEHLGDEKSERSDSDDARNGYIAAAYPQTEYQRCIVHQVRNTLKYVSDKDRKAFANDLKTIYNAPSEQEGREALESDLFSSTYSHVKSAKNRRHPCRFSGVNASSVLIIPECRHYPPESSVLGKFLSRSTTFSLMPSEKQSMSSVTMASSIRRTCICHGTSPRKEKLPVILSFRRLRAGKELH